MSNPYETRAASGQNFAQASTTPLAMPAFTLKRSSRVMPGFRGTCRHCLRGFVLRPVLRPWSAKLYSVHGHVAVRMRNLAQRLARIRAELSAPAGTSTRWHPVRHSSNWSTAGLEGSVA